MNSAGPILEIKDLQAKRGGVPVLDIPDLDIRDGEVFPSLDQTDRENPACSLSLHAFSLGAGASCSSKEAPLRLATV